MALLLGTGVLGAFTTMSTFSVETIQMFDQGNTTSAIVYVFITMMLSPVLALLGWKVAESVFA
jgi:CrcB protein